MSPDPNAFGRALLEWYDSGRRDLPWRSHDGGLANIFYRVWVSEIMLQQTRVEAVIPYYSRFLARFPSIESLAAADEHDVLAAWSGLGYYSRARNLQHAARQIVAEGLPEQFEKIRALRGIGDYTAAALASIVFELPHAAVDGNVLRVIARVTNDNAEITAGATRRRIGEMAGSLLHPRRPGDFNQAMMELGATVCTPRAPDCGRCPVQTFCAARAAGTQLELPVKLKGKATRDVKQDVVIVEREGCILLVRRASDARRLADFWELPAKSALGRQRTRRIGEVRHQIVNDRFRISVWRSMGAAAIGCDAASWIKTSRLASLPLTTVSRKALALAGIPVAKAQAAD